jgi:hypothetical protein
MSKFRVYLVDGTTFETSDDPEKVHAKHRGAVKKIKRIKSDK